MQVNQKNWSCPKKQIARNETIISKYRALFGESLPIEKQYWTLCGQCANANGEPLDGSEVTQLINSGLITAQQFVGVEINPEIHILNQKAFPELVWNNDDFYRSMVKAKNNGEFNPGIVNCDLPRTPDGGASYIARTMAFLTDSTADVLFIANLIMRMRYYTSKDGDYVINLLNQYPQFRYAMTEGNWSLEDWYEYPGAGETGSRTWMGSFIFVNKNNDQ